VLILSYTIREIFETGESANKQVSLTLQQVDHEIVLPQKKDRSSPPESEALNLFSIVTLIRESIAIRSKGNRDEETVDGYPCLPN
jgi:hypothetical protein